MLEHPRLLYRAQKCKGDRRCIQACSAKAIQICEGNSHVQFQRELCERCLGMDCVKACYNEALRIAGRYYSVEELMKILHRDQGLWGSEGGVTFTGGEPLLQQKYLRSALKRCRNEYIHTAIETSALAETSFLLEILQWTDWLLVDLKHMDAAAHKAGTGVDNSLILKNIEAIARAHWPGKLMLRMPVIPGYNASRENIEATAGFMKRLGLKEINLLPFHRLGDSKYSQLGLTYTHSNQAAPSASDMLEIKHSFESFGLRCYLDADSPF